MELIDAVIERLRTLSGVTVTDRGAAYDQGGPQAGNVTVAVDLDGSPGNASLLNIGVDVDVWTDGPDTAGADTLAHQVEALLHGWSVITARQGRVRLMAGSRASVPDESKLAHVTMRFIGRGIRRYT